MAGFVVNVGLRPKDGISLNLTEQNETKLKLQENKLHFVNRPTFKNAHRAMLVLITAIQCKNV